MQVFRCALRIIRGNIIFPLIYIVGLSFMGLFMATSFDFDGGGEQFQMGRGEFSVVDRDGSDFSRSIPQALKAYGDEVPVEDDKLALQDAVAKGSTDYLLIIPEGYGEAFAQAAREGTDAPEMEAVFSYYSMEGIFEDQCLGGYLSLARTLFAADSEASEAAVAEQALTLADQRVEAQVIKSASAVSEADRLVFYLQWNTYTLFAGIVACIGMLMGTLERADVRRRNLASPLSFASYAGQAALACAVVTVVAWAWSFCLGMVAFPQAVAAIPIEGLVLCAMSMLAFCLSPLALGLLLGQLGAGGLICNAVGNIVGLVVSFLGGAWISLDLMSPQVEALAHWLPGIWYSNACAQAAHLDGAAGWAGALPVLQNIAVLVLFAAAMFCIALLVGRLNTRTATAGGNRAAEVV